MDSVATKLIETGMANAGHVSEHDNTALIFACSNKMDKVATALIETGMANADHVDKTGFTALWYAYESGMHQVAKELVLNNVYDPKLANKIQGIKAIEQWCLSPVLGIVESKDMPEM